MLGSIWQRRLYNFLIYLVCTKSICSEFLDYLSNNKLYFLLILYTELLRVFYSRRFLKSSFEMVVLRSSSFCFYFVRSFCCISLIFLKSKLWPVFSKYSNYYFLNFMLSLIIDFSSISLITFLYFIFKLDFIRQTHLSIIFNFIESWMIIFL
jgi:hypothetical protein